jgi:hypothetical protein
VHNITSTDLNERLKKGGGLRAETQKAEHKIGGIQRPIDIKGRRKKAERCKRPNKIYFILQ